MACQRAAVGLLGELGPAEPQLAGGHDLPLDEAADVVARRRLAPDGEPAGGRLRFRERADLILDVADSRVGIEPGLARAVQRGLELRGGLLERRIALERDPLEVGQADRGHHAAFAGDGGLLMEGAVAE